MKESVGISPAEVFILEKCEHKKDPLPIFATFDLVFAVGEMNRLNDGRDPKNPCHYRISSVPMREQE